MQTVKTRNATRFRPWRAAGVALCALLSIQACPAGEEPAPNSAPKLEEVRRQLELLTDRVVRDYLAEHSPGRGKADILMIVGTLYELGSLTEGEPDLNRAVRFYTEAAEMGSPQAKCSLGIMYSVGRESERGSVPRDPERGRGLLEEAAAKGVTRAMLELGAIYQEGRNVDPDSRKALTYFVDAARRGEADALDKLKPVMLQAKEWEEAKPGRKANFPTSVEEMVDKNLTELNIDINFNLERLYSKVFTELGRRLAAETKRMNHGRTPQR